MASPNLPLPSREQCYALSDEQCRRIQGYRDPEGIRTNPEWEVEYQPELIRHYMNMLSFKQIEDAMKTRLEWSYKTYQNRYRDWRFPLDRFEREHVVRELFGLITSQDNYVPSPGALSAMPQQRLPARPLQPLPQQHSPPNRPQPPTPYMPTPTRPAPQIIPHDFFLPSHVKQEVQQEVFDRPLSRLSVSTTGTYASGSTQSSRARYNDAYSSHRGSVATIATTNSSMSNFSHYNNSPYASSQYSMQICQFRQPVHEPISGYWNGVLRVIPCKINHSHLIWHELFDSCSTCGFSPWHSLMVHAHSIGVDTFGTAMTMLRDTSRIDFAGNCPIHYLMSAGVGIEYFSSLFQLKDNLPRNVFGQNPLHVLNPAGLGEQLTGFLGWFKDRGETHGLLIQRDINYRTPLHALLQHPLEQEMYRRVLDVFPFAPQQLRALDTKGRNTVRMMHEASLKIKSESSLDFEKIQAGISEVQIYISQSPQNIQRYGFHDIARGARGLSYAGYYQCSICNGINAHSNSYLDQMICACANDRDIYGPDETGMTPAHALVALSRCNNDDERTPESPSQTAQLFKFLIPGDDPRQAEALHALGPEGNSLMFNVATRGFDEILEYILHLTHQGRRKAAVNFCTVNGVSILEEMQKKIEDTSNQIHIANVTGNSRLKITMVDMGRRLVKCRTLLRRAGAEPKPSITTRWRIS
ncbi:hypothetical protein BJ878DRAFT_537670 [Calycina marina]|uniref:Clr5 domain-containing protein n=1 Tax=Calycina marina TaxID=1763456 RepID=A0A9P7ZCM4_9HELO|nr:hypothetical protein BJ878DRAFT_537670 [Calycina marina]